VFATEAGTAFDSADVRRGLRGIAAAAGLDPDAWTPRELRHSFVPLMSDEGVPIEQIARLVGHAGGSKVTEAVYRKQSAAHSGSGMRRCSGTATDSASIMRNGLVGSPHTRL
jgi:site-specific recombinase XerD